MKNRMNPLKALRDSRGSMVLVKLKDGAEYTGVVESTDPTMNMILKDCTEYREVQNQPRAKYGQVMIRGSSILYVSFSPEVFLTHYQS
ncbi:MAG: U6 snRNA-associated Sm-like protein LSm6 [Desulfurococcales archaeon]|nr:U6 snRNA-associated Sm-like protein LSm6 [Desulfurococcales archaeon]